MNPKHKSLLFKERSCLGRTKFKIIQFIVDSWLPFVSLLHLHFKSYIARQTSSIMDRVARKDMKQGKRFRLSTEVRATLKRKHDRWMPYHAYSRVSKDLSVFRALLQLILSFFQDNSTAVTEEVGCNGKAVKMFSEMIKHSLRDDDFVSRKCMMFNVVLFHYRIRF